MTHEVKITAAKGHSIRVGRTTDGETIETTNIEAGETKAIQFDPTRKNAFTIEADNGTVQQTGDPRVASDLIPEDFDDEGPVADAAPAQEPLGMSEPMPVEKGTITAEEPLGAAKAAPKARAKARK